MNYQEFGSSRFDLPSLSFFPQTLSLPGPFPPRFPVARRGGGAAAAVRLRAGVLARFGDVTSYVSSNVD